MERRTLAALAGLFALLAVLAVATRERPRAEPQSLAAAAGGRVDWSACAAAKCLTVYVAPWCSVCRASTPFINATVDYLNAHGVPARVVVGQGRPAAVAAYARDFGPRTLLDPEGSVPLAGGVPQFIVTAADGSILKRQPGVPRVFLPPIDERDVRDVARYLGLL